MGPAAARKIAKVLNTLALTAFLCNLVALVFVPGLVFASPQARRHLLFHVSPRYFLLAWAGVWGSRHLAVPALFLLSAGSGSAVILWQTHRALKTVLCGEPFSAESAAILKQAACVLLIATAGWAALIFITHQ